MHLSGREPPGRLPKRMRRRHRGDRSPSSGGNLPSDRHLTRHFYSCSKGMSAAGEVSRSAHTACIILGMAEKNKQKEVKNLFSSNCQKIHI